MSIVSNYGFPPEEMIRSSTRYSAVDTCQAFFMKYVGDQVSGLVQIANTTGDLAFEHGASGSEVADTSVNPNGGTPGTIDLSAEAATFNIVDRLVNLSANWEFWYGCALPTDATEAAGTSKIVNNLTDQQCKIAGGYAVLIDTSAALYHSVGISMQDESINIHGGDVGWYHELTQIRATTTYGSGASAINVYKVLDSSGTVTLLESHAGGATTVEKVLPTGGEQWPIYNTTGYRLVVKVVNTAAMTAADMQVFYGSHKFAPSTRKNNTWAAKSIA